MPTWKSSVPDISGLGLEKQVESLLNHVIEQDRKLSWITSKLDSKNVKRLDTNETSIKSADGETVINGPILQMYDKQATPVLRLKQGYDAVTGDFVYSMYNKAGTQTVGIDSNGNATFTGTISASTITGGTITGGAISGGTIDGTTITGGTIQTAATGRRIALSGSELQSLDSNTKDGFTLDGVDGFLRWYTAGVQKGLIGKDTSQPYEQMYLSHAYILLSASSAISLTSPTITIGEAGGSVYFSGTADFSSASSVVGLLTNSYSHAHGGATGAGGTDSHTHSIGSDSHSHSVVN